MNVKAPFDGVIVDLPHYTSDVRIEQGKPIVGIMDYARMYMDINLPESAIGYVKADQPVYITHYTLPKDTIRGVISELSPAISSETRTFKGKILIQNDDLKLRPGMFVKADIVVNKADSAIIIPKDVIQSNRRVKYVYIVEKNTALLRELKTGLEDDKNIQILEGLKERYATEKVTDIDGVKIDFAQGWVHLRKSNTEPIIRIYSEAKDEAAANQLAEEVIAAAKSTL